jgi:hypothetical protein
MQGAYMPGGGRKVRRSPPGKYPQKRCGPEERRSTPLLRQLPAQPVGWLGSAVLRLCHDPRRVAEGVSKCQQTEMERSH